MLEASALHPNMIQVPVEFVPAFQPDQIVLPQLNIIMPADVPAHDTVTNDVHYNRYVIGQVPSADALEQGLDYQGEDGELKAANELLRKIVELDPVKKLADPHYRAEAIKHATGPEALMAVAAVNQLLYGTEGSNFSETAVTLGRGVGPERVVSFVGLEPSMRQEVFTIGLDVMKAFAEKGDMQKAGMLASNIIVGMQMFNDGNKRTARTMYQLIAFGYDQSHYDIGAMQRTLAYTHEARSTQYHNATTSNMTSGFVLETTPQEEWGDTNWAMSYYSEVNARPRFEDALKLIDDPVLKDSLTNVLQQTSFGTQYVKELAPNEFMAAVKTRDIAELGSIVNAILGSITKEKAVEIIEKDKTVKKDYFMRVLQSTTGEKPLASYYDFQGNTSDKYFASFAED